MHIKPLLYFLLCALPELLRQRQLHRRTHCAAGDRDERERPRKRGRRNAGGIRGAAWGQPGGLN